MQICVPLLIHAFRCWCTNQHHFGPCQSWPVQLARPTRLLSLILIPQLLESSKYDISSCRRWTPSATILWELQKTIAVLQNRRL